MNKKFNGLRKIITSKHSEMINSFEMVNSKQWSINLKVDYFRKPEFNHDLIKTLKMLYGSDDNFSIIPMGNKLLLIFIE